MCTAHNIHPLILSYMLSKLKMLCQRRYIFCYVSGLVLASIVATFANFIFCADANIVLESQN